jgi:hypothetical protein
MHAKSIFLKVKNLWKGEFDRVKKVKTETGFESESFPKYVLLII